MYQPKFTITPKILTQVAQAEAARAIIESAPLIPAWEKRFRHDALVRAVHYGTKLEGNDLTLAQVVQVIQGGKVIGKERDIQEVINYRQVMELLEEWVNQAQKNNQPPVYSPDQLRQIHKLTVARIVPEAQAGVWRTVQVVLASSQDGQVVFRPPPAPEIPYLLDEFFTWLNSQQGRALHPILRSGIAHYILVAIHPFVEGNGRTTRAFATLILMLENYNIKGLFALEEYFDRQAEDYFGTLRETSNQPGGVFDKDLTSWLEFYSLAVTVELSRIREKVEKLSTDLRLKKRLGNRQIALTERQIKLVEYMQQFGGLRIADAKELFPMVSDDTIWRDLKKLIEAGLVKKHGSTKGAYYTLAT